MSRFAYLKGLAVLATCVLFATSAMAQSPHIYVNYGGDAEFDACGDALIVEKPNGIGLRSGPGDEYPTLFNLPAQTTLAWCDESRDGQWLGVVVLPDDQTDCGTGTTVTPRQAYDGKCSQGWIKKEEARHFAG